MKRTPLFSFDWSFFASLRAEGLIEGFHGLLFYRGLYVQIVLRHVQIGMSNDALDCRKIDPESLHLGNIRMAAGMRRQYTNTVNRCQSGLDFFPVMFRIEGLFRVC